MAPSSTTSRLHTLHVYSPIGETSGSGAEFFLGALATATALAAAATLALSESLEAPFGSMADGFPAAPVGAEGPGAGGETLSASSASGKEFVEGPFATLGATDGVGHCLSRRLHQIQPLDIGVKPLLEQDETKKVPRRAPGGGTLNGGLETPHRFTEAQGIEQDSFGLFLPDL